MNEEKIREAKDLADKCIRLYKDSVSGRLGKAYIDLLKYARKLEAKQKNEASDGHGDSVGGKV